MTLKEKYRKQLFDPRWISKKKEILSRDNCMCSRCKTFNKLRIHHLVYRIDTDLWMVNINDLVSICEDCQKDYKKTHPSTPYIKFNDKSLNPLEVYLKSDFIKKYKANLPTNGDVPIEKTVDFIESNVNLQGFENFLFKLFAGDYEPKKLPVKRICEYDIDSIIDEVYKDSKGYEWLDEK